MARDIDHAAIAITSAMNERFGRGADLASLVVTPHERTISIVYGEHRTEGTRDQLISAVRKASSLEEFWQMVPQVKAPMSPRTG